MSDKKWKVPPELAAYGTYTNYPGRAEELINSDDTFMNNVIKAAMACEAVAQWGLLTRLRKANLLLHPDDVSFMCKECKRLYAAGCPDCGACLTGCADGFKDNPCTHDNAERKKET
jgi:hypothetical protein